MTLLLVLGALVTLATVWFLVRAVYRASTRTSEHHGGLAQLRDRLLAQLRELEVEEGDRSVDPAVAADERRRLEAELAQVLKQLDAAPRNGGADHFSGSPRVAVAVLVALAVVVPLVTIGLYLGSNVVVLAQLEAVSATASGGMPPMVQEMVARLERRLAEQPNDPPGWARLGRAYAVLGRRQEAQRAYARAYALAPNDTEIVAAYASFLLTGDAAALTPQAVAVLQKLDSLAPQHPAALWGLGLAAYQNKQFAEAVRYWERLLRQLPPESEVGPQVRHALEAARAEARKAKP